MGELLGELPGDFVRGALGLEETGILKTRPEDPQVLRAVKLVVGELVGLPDRAVEVGADDVAVEIADDEQGRVEQGLAVALKLPVSLVEVLLLALVFPAEAVPFPNVGKAALAEVAGVRGSAVE